MSIGNNCLPIHHCHSSIAILNFHERHLLYVQQALPSMNSALDAHDVSKIQ